MRCDAKKQNRKTGLGDSLTPPLKYGIRFSDNPKQYIRNMQIKRRTADPIRLLLNNIRYRCKSLNLECTVTKDELTVPDVCPILGIALFYTPGKMTDNSYSIDRIDNRKGYTKDNCRIISQGANRRKGDLTIEQVERLLAYMKGDL
jgi:hypothetical protein